MSSQDADNIIFLGSKKPFTETQNGSVPAPGTATGTQVLFDDGTWRAVTDVPAATIAEALAGASTTTFLSPATGIYSVLSYLSTRAVAPTMLSDGATANRRVEWTPGTAGAIAGLPMHGHAIIHKPAAAAACCISGLAPIATALPSTQANALGLELTAGGALNLRQTGADPAVNYRQLGNATFFASLATGAHLLTWDFPAGDSTTNPVFGLDGVDITSTFTLSYGSGGSGAAPNWQPTTLDCTKFVSGFNWPAGIAPLAEYGPGAWTVAECLAYAQTCIKPSWWRAATGSGAISYSSNFSAGADSWVQNVGDANLVVTGNVDGIYGVDDVLQVEAVGGNKYFQLIRNSTVPASARYEMEFDYYADVGAFSGAAYIGFGTYGRRADASQLLLVEGGWELGKKIVCDVPVGTQTIYLTIFTTATGSTTAYLLAGKKVYLKNVKTRIYGPVSSNALQPGAVVAPDSGTNRIPAVLAPGMTVPGDKPQRVLVESAAMTADGFVLLDQIVTPAGYKLVSAYAIQTGTETSTLTLRETSSGGTTVATGALSATSTLVELTVSNGLIAGNKKLHLTNSAWAGNTVQVFAVFERIY